MIRRSWVEIDLSVIENNYRIVEKLIAADQEIMAVVKADAYGHGEAEVAQRLQACGCRNFAVSNIEEAVSLRTAGIHGQVLVVGYTPVSAVPYLIGNDITQALLSEEYAEKVCEGNLKAQFAIDTGMNRIGIDADDPEECERIIRKFQTRCSLTGVFTHLCTAETNKEKVFTESQLDKFRNVVDRIGDLGLPYVHCMNSAGGLWQEPYGNLVRLGIVLYGLKPDFGNTLPDGIKPALKWKSVISQVKTVHPGETIGYGRAFAVEREMRIATIPTGYADGYNRLLSNRGLVQVGGRWARVVGNICMDQMMIDVTGMDVDFEDEVTLFGDGYTADDMAHSIGTIGYEIICAISKRVRKEYVGK